MDWRELERARPNKGRAVQWTCAGHCPRVLQMPQRSHENMTPARRLFGLLAIDRADRVRASA